MRRGLSTCLWVVVTACCVVPACFAKDRPKPVYLDPAFSFYDVDTVFIVPTVDLTVEKEKDLERLLLTADWAARNFMQYWGYNPVPGFSKKEPPSPPSRMSVSEDDLKDPLEPWIRKLGPPEARWVLLLALEDASSHLTFGASGKAVVMAMLFDRQKGKLVWRDVGAVGSGQGGLLGLAMGKGTVGRQAVWDCVNDVLGRSWALKHKKNK